MNRWFRYLVLIWMAVSLSGCAGVFLAGAATAVYVVKDPRSSNEILRDKEITFEAAGLGNKDPYRDNVRVIASSFRGNVLLMGQAVDQNYKEKIEAEVSKLKGVKVIYNEIRVRPLLNLGDISNDTWITTKVKSSLLTDSELLNSSISVYTEDSEVFLVGAVSPYHAEKAVEVARHISGVKRVIKAFYYGTEEEKSTAKNVASPKPAEVSEVTIAPSSTTGESSEIPYIQPVEVHPFNESDN